MYFLPCGCMCALYIPLFLLLSVSLSSPVLFLRASAATCPFWATILQYCNRTFKFCNQVPRMIQHFFRFNVSKQFISTHSSVHNFLRTFEASSLKFIAHKLIANTTTYFSAILSAYYAPNYHMHLLLSTIFFLENILLPVSTTVHDLFSDDNCTFQKTGNRSQDFVKLPCQGYIDCLLRSRD